MSRFGLDGPLVSWSGQNLIWHLCGILVQRTTNCNAVLMRDFERYQAEGTYQPKTSPNTTHFSSQTWRWSDRNEELRGVGVCSCDFHLEYAIDASSRLGLGSPPLKPVSRFPLQRRIFNDITPSRTKSANLPFPAE